MARHLWASSDFTFHTTQTAIINMQHAKNKSASTIRHDLETSRVQLYVKDRLYSRKPSTSLSQEVEILSTFLRSYHNWLCPLSRQQIDRLQYRKLSDTCLVHAVAAKPGLNATLRKAITKLFTTKNWQRSGKVARPNNFSRTTCLAVTVKDFHIE